MHAMNRRSIVRAVLVALVAGAAGVGVIGTANAQGKMKIRLVLPTPPTTYQLPYLIPKDTGWFEQHGLEVEEVFVTGDSTALRTVLSGSGDITIIGPPTVFHAYSEGAKLKYVGSWQPLV